VRVGGSSERQVEIEESISRKRRGEKDADNRKKRTEKNSLEEGRKLESSYLQVVLCLDCLSML